MQCAACFILPPWDELWSSRPDNGASLAGLFYFRLTPQRLELQADVQLQPLRPTFLAIRAAVFFTTFLAVFLIILFVVFFVGFFFARVAFLAAFCAGFRAGRFFSSIFIISSMTAFSIRLARLMSFLVVFLAAIGFSPVVKGQLRESPKSIGSIGIARKIGQPWSIGCVFYGLEAYDSGHRYLTSPASPCSVLIG